MVERTNLNRKQLLGLAGTTGAALLVGRRPELARRLLQPEAADADAATLACVLTPAKTEGPYFVDERLNRSDIRVDPADGSVQPGVPVRLTINVYDAASNCAPVKGATVDIWHTNAYGLYSDESANGTVGKKYLRGYQVTDANGSATFVTIYPGWYAGRTIHIHFKVRLYDASSKTYEFTSQIFFDESLSDAVMAQAPYNTRPGRDTRNTTDNIYGNDGAQLTMALTSNGSGGYAGVFNVGLTGVPATTTAATDTAVAASLISARFGRTAAGQRRLALTLALQEAVTADARLLRGGTMLARKAGAKLAAGNRMLTLGLGKPVAAGAASLRLVLTDAAGNSKVIRRSVRVPHA
jgi:protocatechuate 3,4-dioxygenase beta subunit